MVVTVLHRDDLADDPRQCDHARADTRYITIILCPFATAAFVIWGWRWQLSLIIACLFLYLISELRFRSQDAILRNPPAAGMVAALTLSQFTAYSSTAIGANSSGS